MDENETGSVENDIDEFIEPQNDNSSQLSFQQILQIVKFEEKRLERDLQNGKNIIPSKPKKGSCSLTKDSNYFRYLDQSSFKLFIQDRRKDPNAFQTTFLHCCQFITYAKLEKPEIKSMPNAEICLYINKTYPALYRQHFDFLLETEGLKPSSVDTRLDSLKSLIEWIQEGNNSNECFNEAHFVRSLFLFILI